MGSGKDKRTIIERVDEIEWKKELDNIPESRCKSGNSFSLNNRNSE